MIPDYSETVTGRECTAQSLLSYGLRTTNNGLIAMLPSQLYSGVWKFCLATLLASLTACSSGGSTNSTDPTDDSAVAAPETPGDNTGTPPSEDGTPSVPATPLPQTNPPAEEPTLAELGVPDLTNASVAVQEFSSVLENVVRAAMVDMNQKLQSGEFLSDVENQCLGSYDPAIGEAAMGLDCGEERLALINTAQPLYLYEGTLAATNDCNAGLLGLDAGNCYLVSANVMVPVEWTTPNIGLPQPFPSGSADFNTSDSNLNLASLPSAPTVQYQCTISLSDGSITQALGNGCNTPLNDLTQRLQAWLDRR